MQRERGKRGVSCTLTLTDARRQMQTLWQVLVVYGHYDTRTRKLGHSILRRFLALSMLDRGDVAEKWRGLRDG